MHKSTYISPRTDFGRPPKAYIPGAGRGAVGFTTRSDIGPARQAVVPIDRSISAQKERARQILLSIPISISSLHSISSSISHSKSLHYRLQRQLGVPSSSNNGPMLPATPSALVGGIESEQKRHQHSNTHHDAEDLNDSNYDPFTGYATNLFSAGTYDDEDMEADVIYSTIDKRQDSKRKRRREEREKAQWEEYHKKRPKVHEYFLAEKRELADLELSEWENIPEPMDLSRRRRKFNKSTRSEKYTPIPDSIIEGAHRNNTTGTSIDEMTMSKGWETTMPVAGGTSTGIMTTDLTQLGRARDRHLGIQLDKMADSVTGQTVVDPKGYLTDLTSISISSDTDVSDIRKARQLLKSVVTTNPKHPPGWIAAARLEEAAGKLVAARNMILRGTEACPSSQDIWIEAARLANPRESKRILAMAVKKIPKSVKIWLKAANLETDNESKKAVLRKALEIIPNSVILWQTAIDLEDANNARIMLSRAVECVPSSVEMWIALSKLETYENAKRILNRARNSCPHSHLIFIESAKLEENNGKEDGVEVIIRKAIRKLSGQQIVINKEQWFSEAAKCEDAGCPLTCKWIIWLVLRYEEEQGSTVDGHGQSSRGQSDEISILMKYKSDAEEWLTVRKQVHCARSIYAYILSKSQQILGAQSEQIWWDAAQLERQHGTKEQTESVLQKAVEQCPQSVNLWLLAAKFQKQHGQTIAARSILNKALECNSDTDSEKIWLALCRLEIHCGDMDAAERIMESARNQCGTDKIWLHSAKLLRRIKGGGSDEELALEQLAVDKFPRFDKIWMMLMQCYEQRIEYEKCCETAERAFKFVPDSIDLWLEYIRILSSKLHKYAKARSILQSALLRHPKVDRLWLTAAKLELEENHDLERGLGPDRNTIKNGDPIVNRMIYRNDVNYQQCKSMIAKGLQQCPDSGLLYAFEIEIEPLASKKGKCVPAIKKCPSNVHVFTEVGKYFIQIRKLKRAKEWFERAVIANCEYGDAWCFYYWFAVKYGMAEKEQQNIMNRCVQSNPKYGMLWTKVSKRIGNEGLSKKQILMKVVKEWIEPCDGFAIQVV